MPDAVLTLEEVALHLDEVMERARRGGSTLLTDGGDPVARVVPAGRPAHTVGDLLDWLPTRPRLDPEEADRLADDVEAFRREFNSPAEPLDRPVSGMESRCRPRATNPTLFA